MIKTVSDAMSKWELNEVNETIVKTTLVRKDYSSVIMDCSTDIELKPPQPWFPYVL